MKYYVVIGETSFEFFSGINAAIERARELKTAIYTMDGELVYDASK